MTVIGIDPGVNCGYAEVDGGRLVGLATFTPVALAFWLVQIPAPYLVVLEDSRLDSHIFSERRTTGGKASALKIARNVGMVDMVCHMVQLICQEQGLHFLPVSPKGKGAKMASAAFNDLTGWGKASNQHQRDAGLLAWRFRHHHR